MADLQSCGIRERDEGGGEQETLGARKVHTPLPGSNLERQSWFRSGYQSFQHHQNIFVNLAQDHIILSRPNSSIAYALIPKR